MIEPAQPQTVELEESISRSAESESFTLTTHRVMVHDYYIEAEITLLNDADSVLSAWFGSANSGPQLFDDRGRTYPFQVQAGGDKKILQLQSGEGLDAVLVFAGRLDPDARALTLDFSELSADTWSQVTFEVPLGGAR
ncbi:MAG: hypothetical protein Q4P07_06855 [Ornithinimicrobium sp.]|uniref:hypothetical protein n=1 Tax=Ornithinimicrobium sp. TaxID=1977084 RepID=UPI0026DEDBF0|nr:hypothetical protein [Ornithinimicrobium sp.]MDO5739852.1 hypothetical protein [Ornithinimicrobium sp.]